MNQRNTLFPIALITFLLLSSCGNSGIVRGTIHDSITKQIIGKWKLNRTEFIHGATDIPGDGNTFEFFENGDYTRFIWGFESGGTFQLAENELRLNENYRIGDREGSERGEYLLHIQFFEEDSIIISFTECDALVFQTYLPVD